MADEEALISFKSGSTSSKKWKKSNFIFFGGIMGLLVLIFIIIVFAILKNMDEISNLKEQLELEGEHVKSLESQLKSAKSAIFSQKSHIETQELENENLESQLKSAKSVIFSQKSQIETREQENENLKGKFNLESEHVKSLESQLELEIETRKKENTTFSEEIQAIKKFLPNSTIVTDGPYGGYGGNPWSDGPLSTNEDITAIEIREGHILDAIRVRYGKKWGKWHGGNGGFLRRIELNPGATIKSVQGKVVSLSYGTFSGITFFSTDGKAYGPYGDSSDGESFVSARPNCKLAFLSGRSEDAVDMLTLHYTCNLPLANDI